MANDFAYAKSYTDVQAQGMIVLEEDLIDLPIVVTGPTGWIGRASLGWLGQRLGMIAFARNITAFGSTGCRLKSEAGPVHVRPLEEIANADLTGAIVIHLAYLTKDKRERLGDEVFAKKNLSIDGCVLEACERTPPKGVLVASSGAARDVASGRKKDLYGALKLVQEDRFAEAGAKSGFNVFNARIFNIAGPHVNKFQIYALASFLTQGLERGRIDVRAPIPVFRAYTHVEDLIEVAIADILAGQNRADPVDVAGREVVEMMDVARSAARAIGLSDSAVSRPVMDFSRYDSYLGDPCCFAAIAQSHGVRLKSFNQQVRDTASFLSKVNELGPLELEI